jgi:cyclophilin family peptidyl-prolyl cis-trans isomerase
MLGCANLGLEDSNASQFMVTTAPAAQLAGQHTCFGKVLAGYGVIKEVGGRGCCAAAGGGDTVWRAIPCRLLPALQWCCLARAAVVRASSS